MTLAQFQCPTKAGYITAHVFLSGGGRWEVTSAT